MDTIPLAGIAGVAGACAGVELLGPTRYVNISAGLSAIASGVAGYTTCEDIEALLDQQIDPIYCGIGSAVVGGALGASAAQLSILVAEPINIIIKGVL